MHFHGCHIAMPSLVRTRGLLGLTHEDGKTITPTHVGRQSDPPRKCRWAPWLSSFRWTLSKGSTETCPLELLTRGVQSFCGGCWEPSHCPLAGGKETDGCRASHRHGEKTSHQRKEGSTPPRRLGHEEVGRRPRDMDKLSQAPGGGFNGLQLVGP